MTHLTEYEIQELLDASHDGDQLSIPEHVKTCAACQQKIELYAHVFKTLKTEMNAPVIPEHFQDTVIATIDNQDRVFRRNLLFLISFCSLSFVVSMGLAVYHNLISLDPILAPFQILFVAMNNAFQGTILNPLKTTFQTKLSLVLSGFLTLFVTLLIDRFFLQPRFKSKQSAHTANA